VVSFLQVSIPRPSYASRQLRQTVAGWCALASGIASTDPAAIPRVIWADQNLPRPELPYISLRLLTSIADRTQERLAHDVPLTATVTVTTAVTGTAARIALGYGAPGYVVPAGSTLTTVRDGLIAAIEDRPDPVTIVTTGAATFSITGLGPGMIYPIEAIEGVTVTINTSGTVEIVESSRTSAVQVQCFGFTAPDARALDYIDAMISDLGRADTAAYFADRGCAVVGTRPTAVDISTLSGAERESRAYFDLRVAQWTRHMASNAPALVSIVDPLIELERPAAA